MLGSGASAAVGTESLKSCELLQCQRRGNFLAVCNGGSSRGPHDGGRSSSGLSNEVSVNTRHPLSPLSFSQSGQRLPGATNVFLFLFFGPLVTCPILNFHGLKNLA